MLGFFINRTKEKGDATMKGRLVITVIIGLFLLSVLPSIPEAAPAGLPECTNSLNTCTTNLEVCVTGLAQAQTNLASEQTNLAACQTTLAECSQKTCLPSWEKKLPCVSKDNCPRFEVLADWNNEAVLDKETGLVWEKSPELI